MSAVIARCLSGAAKARAEYRKAIACNDARHVQLAQAHHRYCMQRIADLRKVEADAQKYEAAFKAFYAALELYAIDKSDESAAMVRHCSGIMGVTLKAFVERKVSREEEARRQRAEYKQRLSDKDRRKSSFDWECEILRACYMAD